MVHALLAVEDAREHAELPSQHPALAGQTGVVGLHECVAVAEGSNVSSDSLGRVGSFSHLLLQFLDVLRSRWDRY